jgi:hypothetical protein
MRVVRETLQLDAAGAYLFSYLLQVEPDGNSDGLCRTCAPNPLQFIVITVMSVMSGTFPDTYGVST